MLKVGYMEDWKYHNTYSGTPQGGVISPILSNIVLNELDKFIEYELIPQYTSGKKRKPNPEYQAITYQISRAKAAQDTVRYKELILERRQIPSVDTYDDEFRRLYYIRYADDSLLGVIAPKSEALVIKKRIGDFIQSIKLTMSEEKTFITHAESERARFLGYELSARRNNTKLSMDRRLGIKKRSVNNSILLWLFRNLLQT